MVRAEVAGFQTSEAKNIVLQVDQSRELNLSLAVASVTIQAPGELGNPSRTPVSGSHFINTDFSVIKHFPIREAIRLDFRAEFFNLWNHAQFGLPAPDIQSPTFGVVNSTMNNSRVMQSAFEATFLIHLEFDACCGFSPGRVESFNSRGVRAGLQFGHRDNQRDGNDLVTRFDLCIERGYADILLGFAGFGVE